MINEKLQMLQTKLAEALVELRDWYNREVSPKIYRAFDYLSENFFNPMQEKVIKPASAAIAQKTMWVYNNIIEPGVTFAKDKIITPIKDKVLMPTFNYLYSSLVAIYNWIKTHPKFLDFYDLMQCEHTWQTDRDKFDNRYVPLDPTTRHSAKMVHAIAWPLFTALAAVPIMLMIVGFPGNHLFAIGCALFYSFAVAVSFTATVLHNKNDDPKQETTAGVCAGLILMGLVYLHFITGSILINLISVAIAVIAICFFFAHQPATKDYYFIENFNTSIFAIRFPNGTYVFDPNQFPAPSNSIVGGVPGNKNNVLDSEQQSLLNETQGDRQEDEMSVTL